MSEGLASDALELARALIRVDTSNPPGRETAAAELIRDWLAGRGIESELIGPDPERLNLVSRIEGTGEAPSLMLMAHTDVVPAPADHWTVDPFGGVIEEGWLIGRGAVDMKNELAARIAAFAAFVAQGRKPLGDLVLIAESDEERNVSDVGMSWIARERPDLLCDFAINEGGGFRLDLVNGKTVIPVSVGEKKVTSIRLRIHGASAHASVPDREKNAVRDAARVIDRLFAYEPVVVVSESVGESLRAIGAPGDDAEMIAWAAGQHPALEKMVPAMTRMSVTPTGLATREPANVVPPVVEIVCDCRALPDQDESDIRDHIESAIGSTGVDWDMELLEPLEGGFESPSESVLFEVCREFVESKLPGAVLMPMVTAGFTDSHWVRQAKGATAYGFAPVFDTPVQQYFDSMHGADERIRISDLETMAEFHLYAIERLLSS